MQSRQLESGALGRIYDGIAYLLFFGGLFFALIWTWSERDALFVRWAKTGLLLWPAILIVIGFAAFLTAKVGQFRRSHWIGVGCAGMSQRGALLYLFGSLAMIVGFFAMVLPL